MKLEYRFDSLLALMTSIQPTLAPLSILFSLISTQPFSFAPLILQASQPTLSARHTTTDNQHQALSAQLTSNATAPHSARAAAQPGVLCTTGVTATIMLLAHIFGHSEYFRVKGWSSEKCLRAVVDQKLHTRSPVSIIRSLLQKKPVEDQVCMVGSFMRVLLAALYVPARCLLSVV